ncbi:phosphate ABC transporter permease subunit PstC [Candidatus Methylospira mobilis]|uniref:Phosphate transport system permease protein n=1 Tax=Candidatus Methylospira mobilis TaxID=1808979 RepID=A0A5Q0BJK8_9GAMM|nr:phosphate ABC transporter permease subunit PstC [Candidatus Methylospira mobilis]QFY43739.1 phosphate ABC transporter permease subunit PstC [Candidatus Methylospira mobilis]WNV04727.1 phosphate ABC transporter permease subunit PstC [Candidatus Methylospira mobilis]
MQKTTLLFVLLALCVLAFHWGKARSLKLSEGLPGVLHSLPDYYGYMVAVWAVIASGSVVLLWLIFEGPVLDWLVISTLPTDAQGLSGDRQALLNEIHNAASGHASANEVIQAAANYTIRLSDKSNILLGITAVSAATLGAVFSRHSISKEQRARNVVEAMMMVVLVASSLVAIFTTLGIILSVLLESVRFFGHISLWSFLTGLEWSPQIAMRADQVGSSGAFGAVPLFTGTLLISTISLIIAVPIGLLSAIFLAEYANAGQRAILKPLLEILAGIPSVVYGFFAALTVAPFIRGVGADFGVSVSSESALAAGLVMGIMIIPFVSSLSDDFINAVPQSLRDGAYALGATQSETIKQVILPAALPGIVGGILLAASRAIGETMIVVMAAGLSANLTANPLEAVTTVTTQIVTLLVGDQEFDSPKTLAAFALGLVLFLVTLALNVFALHIVRKYREQYE